MRDIIIITVVIILIVGGGIIVKKYIKSSSDKLTEKLENLKQEINRNNIDNSKVISNQIYNEWQELEEKWSIFILHNELDLIETAIVSIKANIESENFENCLEEIDKSKFLLKHIYENEKVCLKNIF